jgi:tRNA dimethylallyltransferase
MAAAGHPSRHLALVGPTASAKSAVAMALARARNDAGLPTEILSCDSMQVYRHMDVGTAKPTPADRQAVRHHLLDLVEPTEEHNLGLFLRAAGTALREVEGRGAHALIVGGTGLYVRGVVDDFQPPPAFEELAAEFESLPTEEIAARLALEDPASAERTAGNRRRMLRALAVTVGSGTPFSQHGASLEHYGDTPVLLCGLEPPRDELAARIQRRYDQQLADGMLDEVRYLASLDDSLSRTAAQALGYRELLAHLAGSATLEEAMAEARLRTRRFAVRQIRWFRRDPRIRWFDAPTGEAEVTALAARIDRLWQKSAKEGVGSVATVASPRSPGEGAPDRAEEVP